MARKIEVNKATSRKQLDQELSMIPQKPPINLDKYFGKINFGVDGLDYQLRIRNKQE